MIVQQTNAPCGVRPKNVQDFEICSHASLATAVGIAIKAWDIRIIVLRPSNDARDFRRRSYEWSCAYRFHKQMKYLILQKELIFNHFLKLWQPYNGDQMRVVFIGEGVFIKKKRRITRRSCTRCRTGKAFACQS